MKMMKKRIGDGTRADTTVAFGIPVENENGRVGSIWECVWVTHF